MVPSRTNANASSIRMSKNLLENARVRSRARILVELLYVLEVECKWVLPEDWMH